MMKKILCLALALLMLVGIFAGCGEKKTGDDGGEVTLKWVMPWYMQDDYDLVSEEINKKLGELMPNTKLELILDMSMASKWSLWMAGRTPFDIALSQYTNDLGTEINKNAYLPLDDLIEQYAPTIKAEREKYEYQYLTGTYNGKLYAIPNIQIHINDAVVMTLSTDDVLPYLDSEALYKEACANAKSTDKLYEIIDKFLEESHKHRDLIDTDTIAPYIDPESFYRYIAKRGYEFLGTTSSNVCYDTTKDKITVVDFHETEEYAIFLKWMRKWFEKGYINPDILSEESGGGRSPFVLAQTSDFSTSENGWENFSNNQYRISLTPVEQRVQGAAVLGALSVYLSIPSTSENPERAMQFLELIRKEEGQDLVNMIAYGIEGTHYNKVSDTEIKAVDYLGQGTSSSKYGVANWLLGTHFNMYVCAPYTEATRAYAKKYYEELQPTYKKTPIYGMSIDNKPVQNQLAQMKSVVEEYNLRLVGGVVADYNSVLAEMQKKMDTAGIDAVIAEYQKQIDEFVAKK